MYMQSKRNIVVVIVTLLLAVTIFMVSEVHAQRSEALPTGVEALLADYNQYLETGITTRNTAYSSQMKMLIAERKEYYTEFFAKGLHTDLTGLDAEFLTDENMQIMRKGNVYYVNLFERVTMYGKPMTISPEEYPLIQAAKWALGQTDNKGIQQELNQYIESTTIGVNESIQNGVEIVFIIKHDIEILSSQNQFQIVKDAFTDKAMDNQQGFDNVIWANGKFVREKPNWDEMFDYAIYQSTIEELGQSLLKDFQPAADRLDEQPLVVTYNRTTAKNYVLTYSSNPSQTWIAECSANLRRNTNVWNPAYSYVWNVNATIRCNDCADFVSQALKQGGIPQDSTWLPAWNNYAWVNVTGLRDYLINTYDGIYLVSQTALQIGEPVIIPGTHIAMASAINPILVSGHTNDRKNHPLAFDYTQFLHISNNP
ncbi:MAG: hypothetical protein Fur0022_33500 [Anaerolineales bacterium]